MVNFQSMMMMTDIKMMLTIIIVSDDGNKLIQTMVNDNCDEINDT